MGERRTSRVGLSVVIAGPASPSFLAQWLTSRDKRRAADLPGLGGSPVNNLVIALIEAGVDVELVTLAPQVDTPTHLEGSHLTIDIGPYRRQPRARAVDFFRRERQTVTSLVKRTCGDLVHAHWTYEFALGALADSTRPTIVSAHDAPFTILRHHKDFYRAIRTAMAVAVRARKPILTAASPYLAKAWRRQMCYRGPIRVLPNIVPQAAVRSAGNVTDKPIILDVADAGPGKNVRSLVEAMPEILAAHPAARLRLVGPGLTSDSLLGDMARDLGIAHSIEFYGERDQGSLHKIYSEACVFVHPSLEESFGMTVAEAMSHELPVVACAHAGAVPWLLADGRCGVLVGTKNHADIAHAVNCLLADVDRREFLAIAAVRRSESLFGPTGVVANALDIYDGALS